MFTVCNFLEISNTKDIPDGFIVEECSKYYSELNNFFVICREHREQLMLEWVQGSLGQFYPLFEKQFSLNKRTAMSFLAANGKIASYTQEFVESCGGVERFKEIYTDNSFQFSEDLTQTEPENSEPDAPDEPADITEPEESMEPTEEMGVLEEDFIGDNEVELVEECHSTGSDNSAELSQDVLTQSESETEEFCIAPNFQNRCGNECIYNADGSLRGLTEGEILNLLSKLREVDKRISLQSLDPDYVMTKDELLQTVNYLETLSPSIFKGFILYTIEKATTEAERIRISAILDEMANYVTSLNKM